jgi:hypothetical protein
MTAAAFVPLALPFLTMFLDVDSKEIVESRCVD